MSKPSAQIATVQSALSKTKPHDFEVHQINVDVGNIIIINVDVE